jgi:hypothetical protein
MTEGPKQFCYRASCNSVEMKLRVTPAESWIVIREKGEEPRLVDIPDAAVRETVAAFEAIGTDPAKFDDFVRSVVDEKPPKPYNVKCGARRAE